MNNLIELDYDLLSLLPPWYREILDYQEMCKTAEAQFEALANEIVAVADNFFFQTMDEGSVLQWEQILGILADPTTETLEFRQQRLINRISIRPPYTLAFLYQKLDELIGPGQWNVRVDYPNYALYIESYAASQDYAIEVAYTIGRIKPAHISYISSALFASNIKASEVVSTVERVWNYTLGAWSLGALPFASDNILEVLKTADIPSVQQQLLSDIATFSASDIASAQVNGTTPVTIESKSTSGNVLTVTLQIQPSDTDEVNSVQLLDSSGNALTSAAIYLPITTTQLVTSTITFEEGTQ